MPVNTNSASRRRRSGGKRNDRIDTSGEWLSLSLADRARSGIIRQPMIPSGRESARGRQARTGTTRLRPDSPRGACPRTTTSSPP
jgi:hypothetical protein